MIALPPIQFDRTTGVLEGANAWERLAALALSSGSKVASAFSHRGYNSCANLLRRTLPERDIAVKLNPDATFEFPYGDGYWSKLLNRSYCYEDELELLFRDSADVDYTLIDCGANFGYWSVLVSSAPYGSHKAIAIEPSSQNFAKLKNNAEINGNRFEIMNWRSARRAARRGFPAPNMRPSASPAVRIAEVRRCLSSRSTICSTTARFPPDGKYLIKLDVEGVEIDAIKGGTRLLQGDSVVFARSTATTRTTPFRDISSNRPRSSSSSMIHFQIGLKPRPSFRFSIASRFQATSATTCSARQARSGKTGSMR